MTFDPAALTTTGQELYDGIAPIMQDQAIGYNDAENEYVGAALCGAIATMVDPVSIIVRDQSDGTPGWAILFQPENTNLPASWLPWVAQFAGDSAAVLGATSVAAQRSLVANPVNFYRGRASAIKQAIMTALPDTTQVYVVNAPGGTPFTVGIVAINPDTDPPTGPTVLTQIITVATPLIPAWVIPTYSRDLFDTTIANLESSYATVALVESAFPNIAALEANTP